MQKRGVDMSVFLKTILYIFGMGDNPVPVQIDDDSESIRKDWQNVGLDILTAVNKYEAEDNTH